MLATQGLWRRIGLTLLLAAVGLTLSAAVYKSVDYNYSVLDKEFYLPDYQIRTLQPGLNISITDYAIAEDGTVSVMFTVADDGGQPLDLDGVFTPGSIRVSFMIAYIPEGGATFVGYTTRTQTSPITGESAVQPTSDSGGAINEVEFGTYEYVFGNALPADFNADATHRIIFYAERDLETYFEMGEPMDDGWVDFVPSGGDVVDTRDVVTNEACARCHDPLRIHGRRHSYELCVTCHYPGVIDPDTGNTVDLPVMIHKIHMGADLPSVQEGTPYQIIGFRQSVHDYSGVVFPQDHRNCTTCHAAEASQADLYKTNPNRADCGSCHDDVIWETGENHAAGPQDSDEFCANCHGAEGPEFGISVPGAHTIVANSEQLAGFNIELLDVIHMGPGTPITVMFSMTNDDGSTIDPAELDRLRFQLAGPNTDYTFHVTETATDGAVPVGSASPSGVAPAGEFTYTFETPLPEDATGSYTVGVEGRREVVLNPGTDDEIVHEEQANNTVLSFAVTDDEPMPRRTIVSDEKCEACHENLSLHGDNRKNASGYCQVCHNPLADDSPFRAEEDLPARSIDFKMLIHRIHRGEELTRDYTQIGFRGSVVNYNHVLYPGDLRNCSACHVGDSWQRARGDAATITMREFFSPMAPNTASCLGCHDDVSAAAHAYLANTDFGEGCGACHGSNRNFSVARSHAR